MRLRNRILPLALASVLVTAGACSDDDDASPDASTTTTEAADGSTDSPDDGTLEGTLTVYSGRDPELIEQVIDLFEEANPGVEVFTRYGNSAEMGAQLLEEGDRSEVDVFYSQEVGAVGVLARAGLLGELPQETIDRVEPRFQPGEDNLWVGVTGRSRVIAYNPTVLEAEGVEVPEGVLELTDPAYEGLVAWVPDNAGFQAFVTGFRVSQGDDAAREWLEAMAANGAERIGSNSETLAAIEAGDKALGLINHYYWGQAEAELDSQVARLVFPAGDDPGGLVNATAVAVTTRGTENPAAQAFVDFLLSDEVQALFASELFEYPVVPGIPGPDQASELIPPLAELEGPQLDLTDLDDLEATQALLRDLGLIE